MSYVICVTQQGLLRVVPEGVADTTYHLLDSAAEVRSPAGCLFASRP